MDRQFSKCRSATRHIAVIIALCLLVAPFLLVAPQAAMANSLAERLGLSDNMIPVDFGQTDLRVFVPETGHTVSGAMLDYWRANGAASVYGNPVSEVFAAPNGLFSQAFERGVFQYHPDWTMTDNPTIRLMPIARDRLADQAASERSDGRRTTGDRRLTAWQPGIQQDIRSSEVYRSGGRFSEVTGFSIADEFAQWYDSHEGEFYLGAPISEPMRERGITVQYFENAVLNSTAQGVGPDLLFSNAASRYGFDPTPVERGNLPAFSESLFIQSPNPDGVDVSNIPGRKSIVVSIADQTLTAYQGDRIVLQTLVSTGVNPNGTEVGFFHVRIKYELKDMTGVTDGSGAVTQVGTAAEEANGTQYLVQDVPDVMFINYQAEALHGAYWHDNFGQRMSHGCINLPLDVSAFLFDWAPLGTPVTVRE